MGKAGRARTDQARGLILALLSGCSRAEIASLLGLSGSQGRRLIAQLLKAPHGNAGRIVGARLHRGQLARLDVLAARAEVGRQEMASRLLRAALSAGPGVPDRLLGREARPRRRYVRKPCAEAERTRDCRYASIMGRDEVFGEVMEIAA